MSNESIDKVPNDCLSTCSNESFTGSECYGTGADFHLESSDSCCDSSMKKESEDIFKNVSDMEKAASQTNSDVSGTGSNEFNFEKESDEDVFEDGSLSESGKESNILSNMEHDIENAKFSQLPTRKFCEEDITVYEKFGEGASEEPVEHDTLNKTYFSEGGSITIDASTKDSVTDVSLSNSGNNSAKVLSEHVAERDETGKELKYVKASPTSPKSPLTTALKALKISDSPSSENNTPRKSRFRAKTTNIFDSPYNTRLKARMIREREIRSQSEGRSSEE